MANYKLLDSFGIDDGELYGLADDQIFVLGYEYALFVQRVVDHQDYGHGFQLTVNAINRQRMARHLHNKGLHGRWQDQGDGWVMVTVAPSHQRPRSISNVGLAAIVFVTAAVVSCIGAAGLTWLLAR